MSGKRSSHSARVEKCKQDENGDGIEDTDEKQPCGWYFDDDGVIHDPDKRAVFGDYDLQGVYLNNKLIETNAHTEEGLARLRRSTTPSIPRGPTRSTASAWSTRFRSSG